MLKGAVKLTVDGTRCQKSVDARFKEKPSLRALHLYKKREKSYFRYRLKRKVKRTTYILGASCRDGVVLVGDRKVTGGVQRFAEKIKPLEVLPSIVFTAAGVESLFEEFLDEVKGRSSSHARDINTYNKERPDNPKAFTVVDFKHICATTLKKMKRVYSEIENAVSFREALQVLFIVSELKEEVATPRLYYMDMETCYPQPIEQGRIVPIGDTYTGGDVFLKQLSNGNFSIRDVARIGAFIIKYVEQEKLSDTIGVGNLEPQVWFIEEGEHEPKQILDEELKSLLDGVDEEVTNVIEKIGSSSGFLRS